MLCFIKPERVLSFDESRIELDMTQASKSREQLTVVDKTAPASCRKGTLPTTRVDSSVLELEAALLLGSHSLGYSIWELEPSRYLGVHLFPQRLPRC